MVVTFLYPFRFMPLPLLLLWTDGVVLFPAAVESVTLKAVAPIIVVLSAMEV